MFPSTIQARIDLILKFDRDSHDLRASCRGAIPESIAEKAEMCDFLAAKLWEDTIDKLWEDGHATKLGVMPEQSEHMIFDTIENLHVLMAHNS